MTAAAMEEVMEVMEEAKAAVKAAAQEEDLVAMKVDLVAMEEDSVVEAVMEAVVVDYKRVCMQLDILFLRQRNILHQSSYCCNSVHVLGFDSNNPHCHVCINSGMY